MENTRLFDREYDSDEPLIQRSTKRPADSPAEDAGHQVKKTRTKTETEERLANQFAWMDAINSTAKYDMQAIFDELQERIDQLERELATSKVEAGLAYNANVALGSLTVRHAELLKTKEALQEELSLAKIAINAKVEGKSNNLREELHRAMNKLRLKEIAEEKLKETHKQQLKAREDQIHLEYQDNTKIEAWKLKAEWEAWCKTRTLKLGKKTKILIGGEIHFTDLEMKTAVEIIRCSDSENTALFENFIWTARPGLQYEEYSTDPLPDTKPKDIGAINERIQKKLPVKLYDACLVVRFYLLRQRRQVLACIRSHPYYGRCGRQAKLQMAQECVNFFDRRFTFQVARLVDSRHWSPREEAPMMSLGGTEDTAALRGLAVGSYQINEIEEMDKTVWRALTK